MKDVVYFRPERTKESARHEKHYFRVLAIALVAVAVFTLCTAPAQPTPDNKLKVFASADQLSEFLQGQQSYGSMGGVATNEALGAGNAAAPQTAEKSAGDSYSTTNIQVAGVDEADFVKNDGKYIYTISDGNVVITDAYPAEGMKILSMINLTGSNPSQIYIDNDRLVVFGNNYNYYGGPVPMAEGGSGTLGVVDTKMSAPGMPIRYGSSTTYIKVYDVSDRANPVLKRDLQFNGSYYNSRLIGDKVYAVLTVPTYGGIVPVFSPYQRGFQEIYYFDVPSYSYQYTNIVSLDVKDDAAEIKNKVFLLGYSTSMYVSQDSIYLVYKKQLSPYYTVGKTLDIMIPYLPANVADEINTIRASSKSDYRKYGETQLVLNEWMQNNPESAASIQQQISGKMDQIYRDIQKEQEKSVVHRIAINGDINYVGSGEVPGTPLNQFSMDESGGYFRIATTVNNYQSMRPVAITEGGVAAIREPPSREPSSTNNVYGLDKGMHVVGKLENLAPGEHIYSARFIGDRGYLVTFKQVDPLFVIDLSDPASPKVLGELVIPGWSDYLHPYDETHLIGIGKDVDPEIDKDKVHSTDAVYYTAVKGLKISLFDVTDVTHPVEQAKYVIGDRGTSSEATNDHHAFLFSKERNLLVIPVSLYEQKSAQDWGQFVWQGAYALSIDPSGITVKGRVSHANSTDAWTNQVRRSLYIGDVLYTVSDGKIKANSLTDFADISAVDLPRDYYYGGPIGIL